MSLGRSFPTPPLRRSVPDTHQPLRMLILCSGGSRIKGWAGLNKCSLNSSRFPSKTYTRQAMDLAQASFR